MACRNSGIMAYHRVGEYFRPQKWLQRGWISLERHVTRLKRQNSRFSEFWNRFSGNSGIPGVLKSSLSDSSMSITYNYVLTLLRFFDVYGSNRQKLRKIFDFPSQKCWLCLRISRQRRRISSRDWNGLEIFRCSIDSTLTAWPGLRLGPISMGGKKRNGPGP